jgi:hypothetical protein
MKGAEEMNKKAESFIEIEIKNPYVIVYKTDRGMIQTQLHPGEECSNYQSFGLLIADIIHHTARCFNVKPEQVVEWVNKELANPTTKIEGGIVHS